MKPKSTKIKSDKIKRKMDGVSLINFPKNGRVVIIDDRQEEAVPLMRVLSKYRISTVYFTGRKEELPEEPFSDVRIVFLDEDLEGITGRETKTIISTAVATVTRIVDEQNGPFILALWAKRDNESVLNRIKDSLENKGYHIISVNLQKSDFYELDGEEKMEEDKMFEKLNQRLHEKLEENKVFKIFDIFTLWENIVSESVSTTINEFSKFVDSGDDWSKKMQEIFYKLAKAWAGEKLNVEDSQEIIKNALFTFNGVFEDTLNKKIHDMKYHSKIKFREGSAGEPHLIGKINSRLILDKASWDKLYPGNVYLIDNDSEKEKIIENCTYNVPEKQKEELIKKSKLIMMEVSPICDFVQKKIEYNYFIKGFLCPYKISIEGRCKEMTKCLKNKNTKFLYISPIIEYEEKPYLLVLNFHYFFSIGKKVSNKAIFRIRKELLIDIQAKLSAYINRPGVLFLDS